MRALLVVIGFFGVVAMSSTHDAPSAPDGGQYHRWQCGVCVCCSYGDGKVHTDCPGDPAAPPGVCACCQ